MGKIMSAIAQSLNEHVPSASVRFRIALGLSEIEPKRIQCVSVSEKAMVHENVADSAGWIDTAYSCDVLIWISISDLVARRLLDIYCMLSRDSIVSTATGYGLDDRGVGVRVLVVLRLFSPLSRPALGPSQPPIE
jgi:hypothetical protein